MKMWRALAFASFPLALCIFVFAAAISQAQVWTQYGPAARFAHTAVFDPVSKKMMIFGGQDSATARRSQRRVAGGHWHYKICYVYESGAGGLDSIRQIRPRRHLRPE